MTRLSLAIAALTVPFLVASTATRTPKSDVDIMGPSDNFQSIQLHVHGSLSEGTGRMIDHASRARELGIDALWWTDHVGSYSFSDGTRDAFRFDFEEGLLVIPEVPGEVPGHGFRLIGDSLAIGAEFIDTLASQGSMSLALVGQDGASATEPVFNAYRYHLTDHQSLGIISLYHDLQVNFQCLMETPPDPDRVFTIRCLLSNNLAGQTIVITYMMTDGPMPEDNFPWFWRRLPHPALGQWTPVSLPLSQDARELVEFGQDLSVRNIDFGWRVKKDGYSSVLIDEFRYESNGPSPEEIMLMQWNDLNSLIDPSPTHYVGYEAAGGPHLAMSGEAIQHHINIFSRDGIPLHPDYETPGFDPDEYPQNIVRWAQDLDYVVSYTHLYGAQEGQIDEDRAEQREAQTILTGAYEADLLEVGYAYRRRPIESFMQVWDNLPFQDAYPTGIGTSDAHHTHPWSLTENRFVTWVYMENLAQADVLNELTHGRACFGDPYIVGPNAFVALRERNHNYTMGDVVVGHQSKTTVKAIGRFDLPEMELSIITVHSDSSDTSEVMVDSPFDVRRRISLSDMTHVRVELRDPISGALALASNPVYFRREAPDRSEPGMRERRILDFTD